MTSNGICMSSLAPNLSKRISWEITKTCPTQIYPGLSYAKALIDADIESLFERRQFLTNKLFKKFANDQN